MSNFKKASRDKVRFDSSKGLLTVEDLWDLSLESLDKLAKAVNKTLKADSEESFIGKKSTANAELELKLDILKEVIADKLAEKDAAKLKAEKAGQIDFLKKLLEEKEIDELKGLTKEQIAAKLEELRA